MSPLKKQKFEHLFKILDFDHNGLIEESDFISLGENISIFSCINPQSATEKLIQSRSREVWAALISFVGNENLNYCNLETWLDFMDDFSANVEKPIFDRLVDRMVNDIFNIYDKNHDDFLQKQEFMCFFVSLRVEIKQVNSCFMSLDLNGDGKISRQELYQAVQEFFMSDNAESNGNYLFGETQSFQFKTRTTVVS